MLELLIELQGIIREQVIRQVHAFEESRDNLMLLAVLPIGIVFGAVHALTPGHSKTVLATYVIGSASSLLRAITVAFALASTHVLMATAIALFALPLVARTLGGAGDTPLLDNISRGIIGVIGLWLILYSLGARFGSHAMDRYQGLSTGIAAGLIPCPLTLFVMTFAIARGVPEVGLTFAMSMLIGVALTLSGLAALAVSGREIAVKWTNIERFQRFISIAAGLALITIAVRELLL